MLGRQNISRDFVDRSSNHGNIKTQDILSNRHVHTCPGVDVETLRSDRVSDWAWQNYLSHCPWLVTTRQTFFNDLVLSKVN